MAWTAGYFESVLNAGALGQQPMSPQMRPAAGGDETATQQPGSVILALGAVHNLTSNLQLKVGRIYEFRFVPGDFCVRLRTLLQHDDGK